MMFVVRTRGERPSDPAVRIALVRATPSIVPDSTGQTDFFCVGDDAAPDRLREQGWQVVTLRDGWYQGDDEGGVAIWGQGHFWEVRDTPFSVKEAVGPASDSPASAATTGDEVDIRRGILGS
jgi:hypothetical protein